jgi:flagellar motor switch protein FliN
VNVDKQDPGSKHDVWTGDERAADAGALGWLPRLSRRQTQLDERLLRLGPDGGLQSALALLDDPFGSELEADPVDVQWRASGAKRPHLVIQLAWPRLSSRLALGIETPLAHAFVDRLLGSVRPEVEGRLQLTPVEWGIMTFLVARGLRRLRDQDGPLGRWDLSLDRVSPDPFDVRGLGPIVTLRWPVVAGQVAGSIRLWAPESLLGRWLASQSAPPSFADPRVRIHLGALTGEWRSRACAVDMPRGLARLRVGGVLPLGGRLGGNPQSPTGIIELGLEAGRDGRFWFLGEPVAHSGGGRIKLTSSLQRDPTPREALTVTSSSDPSSSASPQPTGTDVPVTLVVELGRVSLSLNRLADLRPGDVVELGRHSREPVELTSGGRLVARGELVQVDTELGVRVTNVFL